MAQRVHFNWMARGEALFNLALLNTPREALAPLQERAGSRGLVPSFNVSTILPTDLDDVALETRFGSYPIILYYSLYSLDPAWRRRWLPRALPAEVALDRLASWQQATGQDVVLHWAFIRGENDSVATVEAICDAVERRRLRVRFNTVRYNPFDARKGSESDLEVVERNFEIIRSRIGQPGSRIVPRVGFDVQASCGMFMSQAT